VGLLEGDGDADWVVDGERVEVAEFCCVGACELEDDGLGDTDCDADGV
jgi:hypothetical protein